MAKVGFFFKEEKEEEKNGTPDVESQSCKHLCEGVCSAKHHRQIGAVSKTSPHALTCINYACRKRSRVKTTGGGRRGVSEEGSD